MSEVQKDPEDVSAGIGQKTKYEVLNKFSCNLRSKSARSTLTSPGPIRVKGIVQRDLTGVKTQAQTISTDKLSCRPCFDLNFNGTPHREKLKTGFSVVTTIELKLLVKLTKSCKRWLACNELKNYLCTG
jgi:hypothetical protein